MNVDSEPRAISPSLVSIQSSQTFSTFETPDLKSNPLSNWSMLNLHVYDAESGAILASYSAKSPLLRRRKVLRKLVQQKKSRLFELYAALLTRVSLVKKPQYAQNLKDDAEYLLKEFRMCPEWC